MAKKKYLFRQERKFNGDVTMATATYECEESEAQAIVAVLEGKISVLVEDVALSSAPDASNTVTTGLPIENIVLSHSNAKSKYFGAYNKPMLFKQSTSVVELQQLFKLHKPFTDAYETEFPDKVIPRVSHMGAL